MLLQMCFPKNAGSLVLHLVFIIFYVPDLSAQNQQEVDSLQALLPGVSSEQKVDILLDLSSIFLSHDEVKAKEYIRQAHKLAEELNYQKGTGRAWFQEGLLLQQNLAFQQARKMFDKSLQVFIAINDNFYIAKNLNNIGNTFLLNGQYREALPYYEKALPIFQKGDYQKSVADCLINIGISHDNLGNYSRALHFYLQALEIDEALNNKVGIGYDYISISSIHGKLNNTLKSIEYQQKALAIFEQLNDQNNVATTHHNLGISYKNLEQFDSALFHAAKAMEIFKDIESKRGIAYTFNTMGLIYFEKNNDTEALENFRHSNGVARELGNEVILSSNYRYISDIFLNRGQLDSAAWYAEQGLNLAENTHVKEVISEFHLLLSDIFEHQNQFQEALYHHQKHLAYQDTLLNEAKTRQLQELEIQYETEKKEQQISLQESMLRNKNLTQQFLIGIILLILVASGVIFKIHRSRQAAKRRLLNEQLKYEKLQTEKMKELEQLKSRFFANIAHEFRTPLTLIMGPMEQIMDTTQETPARQAAGLAYKSAQQLLTLINQLLELSRLEAGEGQMHFVERDFIAFAKGILMSFESLQAQKNIHLKVEAEEAEIIMIFDAESLEKILSNLLSNAFKFTPSGGAIAVKINKSQLNQGGILEEAVRIDVSDTGIGIRAEDLPHVFDRFYRTAPHTPDNTESVGIGLALVKELVDLHRGSITVQSKEQEGTTFTILLPLRQAEYEPDHADPEQMGTKTHKDLLPVSGLASEVELTPEEAVEEEVADKELVLVVDDNPDVRNFIVQSLQRKYRILEAADGKEGIEMAITHVPDLIVCDVMMPKIDGYEACKTLKLDEKTSHIPIVLLTAKWGMESKLQGLETGADEYLSKPFNTKELLMRIHNLITVRKSIHSKYLKELQEQNLPPGQTSENGLAPRERRFLEKVKEAVKAELDDEDFGVEELSQALYMSRKNLHRKLKALTGQTPSLFIRMIRLQEAKTLLESGNYSVQEVAYRVGFNSATYFSTCFSAQFGYAPSDEYSVKK